MANGELKLPSVQSILVDEGYGVQLAVQHLYDRGHRNISFVMDTQKDAAVRKRNGFLMKMKQFGYDDAKERILYTGYGVADCRGCQTVRCGNFYRGFDGYLCDEHPPEYGIPDPGGYCGDRVQ